MWRIYQFPDSLGDVSKSYTFSNNEYLFKSNSILKQIKIQHVVLSIDKHLRILKKYNQYSIGFLFNLSNINPLISRIKME